ncbi:MAG: leucine-rich repeat protein [Bacteroidales bacterium]|nr:leucine-rich repeat protein [Bacteroidales bacterium]
MIKKILLLSIVVAMVVLCPGALCASSYDCAPAPAAEEEEPETETPDYLCILFSGSKSGGCYRMKVSLPTDGSVRLKYSEDKTHWHEVPTDMMKIAGNNVWVRATDKNASLYGCQIKIYSDATITGNIMSLLDSTCQQTSVSAGAFVNLFNPSVKNSKIIDVSGLLLPGTQLGDSCYKGMFEGCSSIQRAPELPATQLAKSCYENMFQGCTSLTIVPKLPATELVEGCYKGMFEGCSKLSALSVGLTSWRDIDATTDWLKGVAETGNFFSDGDLEGINLPEGWVVNLDYFTFTALEENTKVFLYGVKEHSDIRVLCSYDRIIWRNYDNAYVEYLSNVGDKLYWRATDKNQSLKGLNFGVYEGKAEVSGNIMSLLDASCQQTEVPAGAFHSLFANCAWLTKAPELPFKELGDSCYAYMFDNCRSLTEAPELPATELSRACYMGMFQHCRALTEAPVLAAKDLAPACYQGMFESCTALKNAPELPAQTLADSCYYNMFQNCTALTETPVLTATQLADGCYQSMFHGCKNLSKVYITATDLTADRAMGWLSGVSDKGLFYCPETFLDDTFDSSGMWGKPLNNGWKFNAYKDSVQLNAQGYATYSTPLAQRIVKGAKVASCQVNGVAVTVEPLETNLLPAGVGVLLVGTPNAKVEFETLAFTGANEEPTIEITSDLTPATTADAPFEALPATGYIYLLRNDKFEAWFDADGTKKGSEKYCGQGMAYLVLDKPVNATSLNIVTPEMTLRTADATISECGYTTLCVAFNAAVPEGATVYALRRIDANGLHFSKVNALVAKEGYIVEGAAGQTFTFSETYDDVADKNLLQGVAEEAFVSSLGFWGYTQENNLYDYPWILAKDGTFKRYTGSIIPAGKAYLDGKLLQNVVQNANAMRVILSEDETTGLSELAPSAASTAEYYTLEGQRLRQPAGFCIERGKKVLIIK